ncbi:[protein-PII] uridylyltransferase family protein [Rubripirellula amarantea]|nr:glutamate-ammonia-ligase adenylyltransferase [Rubripirellula amarantea]
MSDASDRDDESTEPESSGLPVARSPMASAGVPSWAASIPFAKAPRSCQRLETVVAMASDPQQAGRLRQDLVNHLSTLYDPDSAAENLTRFLQACRDPDTVLKTFDRSHGSLGSLLRLFSISQTLANRFISDPESFQFDFSGDRPLRPGLLVVGDLVDELSQTENLKRAYSVIRGFVAREISRIARDEFDRGTTPQEVGRMLARTYDVALEAALHFTLERLIARRGKPLRPDGTSPEVTVIGLGNYGGEEIGYGVPLNLIFLFDSIDHRNSWHRDFYETMVDDVISLLCGDPHQRDIIVTDLRQGPRFEVGVKICSFREAAQIYETSGRAWQRMKFIKARVVAGSQALGHQFLDRLKPWIYRQYTGGAEFSELQAIQAKLTRRTEEPTAEDASQPINLVHAPGGLRDLEDAVAFLQILHGGYLPMLRQHSFYEAVSSLRLENCLSEPEANVLAEHYARLWRLHHQLSISFDQNNGDLPTLKADKQRLAWHLGIRSADDHEPDAAKFIELLENTLAQNRLLIRNLMSETRLERSPRIEQAVETELLLDPNPDHLTVEKTMRGHGLSSPDRAMEDLAALSTESVPFLSPHRCRHAFASVAPQLLKEISRTPDPDATLAALVQVADSLGAKATLWDLLGSHQPTMELVVRMCATTPYLTNILIDNPGMVDELIDSLLVDHLPSAGRLDAHSIELCRGATDVNQILHGFKSSAHLTIGVRDVLGKETIESTQAAIGDTAEACVRRLIEREHTHAANRLGDPVDTEGNPSELVTIALGKFGGREPNYHSDLDAIFLYSAEGETQRRVGGRRTTTSNHLFFNQVARAVIDRVNDAGPLGRLFELDSRMVPFDSEGVLSISVDEFLSRFRKDIVPLWQRLALCKARVISGSRLLKHRITNELIEVISSTKWTSQMAVDTGTMRLQMEQTASKENLKRGEGGTVDIELVAQLLTLRHANENPGIIQTGTTATLESLRESKFLSPDEAKTLLEGYRTLRRTEANLRLMNTPARHELPDDDQAMANLAFLMGEATGDAIRERCEAVRVNNRRVFNEVLTRLST